MRLLVLLLNLVALIDAKKASWKSYYCSACHAVITLTEEGIANTTINYKVQTRFRIDEKKSTTFARTEDNVIQKLEAAVTKEMMNKWLTLEDETSKNFILTEEESFGTKPTRVTKRQIVQAFHAVSEDNFEVVVKMLREELTNPAEEICVKKLKACKTSEEFLNLKSRPKPKTVPVDHERLKKLKVEQEEEEDRKRNKEESDKWKKIADNIKTKSAADAAGADAGADAGAGAADAGGAAANVDAGTDGAGDTKKEEL